jgi:transcriptional regulator with XRE-family HTH domain
MPPTLANSTYEIYPHWDIESPSLPARSRLFRLEPIGIGTAEVESLTSYIARLAEAHCASPRQLLCEEILAPAGKHTAHYSASPLFSGEYINSMGCLAELTATTLEHLTIQRGLHVMTMLPWRNILSQQQLIKAKKAWCATCYQERARAGGTMYDSLIWMLKSVLTCQKHREQLSHVCPHCSRHLPLLSRFYRPGHCSRCQRWLGVTNNSKAKRSDGRPAPTEGLKQRLSFVDIIGELLSVSPSFTSTLTIENFRANLSQYIKDNACGSINLFSDYVQIWSGTIRRLTKGEIKLSLEVLCRLCFKLGISPFSLFSEPPKQIAIDQPSNIYRPKAIHLKAIVPWNNVKDYLQAALKETPPPSLEAVGRRIGYYPPRLKNHFPKLCERIASRYWKYIESKHPSPGEVKKVLKSALKEQPPPSLQSILRRLGCRDTGYYYYSNYYDLCIAIARRYTERRNKPFDRMIDGKLLQDALSEDPPPSLSELGRRLYHGRKFLRLKFPELSKAVAARYMQYQNTIKEKRADTLRQTIRQAVTHITAAGLYVSAARVKEYVKQRQAGVGREYLFQQAFSEVKVEMGIVK